MNIKHDIKRQAKIVCTIGPATQGSKNIHALVRGGMDVARLNFSHGDHESHAKAIKTIRGVSSSLGRPVAILQDLQGIKIRTGMFPGGSVLLKKGSLVEIAPGTRTGSAERIYVSYGRLIEDVRKGDHILLDDGIMEIVVTGKSRGLLQGKVLQGGILKDKKGVNLPGTPISASSFTKKDREDLAFGIKEGVDLVAVSFVRSAEDVAKVKSFIARTSRDIPVIAKIERPEAVADIDAILDESYGVMVARGDLGVEMPTEEVPLIQKMLIEQANMKGRLVITATQMLESMTEHSTPTRAEATDVANAVIDGTDALMLSAETSTGRYPLKALAMMDRIIRKTEQEREIAPSYLPGGTYSEAIAQAATEAAEDIGARYIVAFTQSGYTARLLSKFRPSVPIIAFTSSEETRRRLSLCRGVTAMIMRPLSSTDEVFREVERSLFKKHLIKQGESIAITASAPIGGAGKTNVLKLHRIPKAR